MILFMFSALICIYVGSVPSFPPILIPYIPPFQHVAESLHISSLLIKYCIALGIADPSEGILHNVDVECGVGGRMAKKSIRYPLITRKLKKKYFFNHMLLFFSQTTVNL